MFWFPLHEEETISDQADVSDKDCDCDFFEEAGGSQQERLAESFQFKSGLKLACE